MHAGKSTSVLTEGCLAVGRQRLKVVSKTCIEVRLLLCLLMDTLSKMDDSSDGSGKRVWRQGIIISPRALSHDSAHTLAEVSWYLPRCKSSCREEKFELTLISHGTLHIADRHAVKKRFDHRRWPICPFLRNLFGRPLSTSVSRHSAADISTADASIDKLTYFNRQD